MAMPCSDMGNYEFEVFLDYAKNSVELWHKSEGVRALPEKIYLNYVLYHRVNEEEIAPCQMCIRDRAYIFDRFYRTDVSRNSSKGGSGIGLSIVKKIMEDHGGKVWATSREGIGTIMYFVLRKYQEVPMK